MTKAIIEATATIEARFFDLDPLNIVWHGNYPRFFEIARCALMERIGYGYEEMRASGYVWPVVDMHMRFYRPMRLNRPASITASLREWESRMKIAYLIVDPDTKKKITRGHTVQVALDIRTEEMQWATPPVLREKLAPFLD